MEKSFIIRMTEVFLDTLYTRCEKLVDKGKTGVNFNTLSESFINRNSTE